MDIGYWSSDCEKWFQAHLQDILDDKATLKTAHEWRAILKKFKPDTPLFVAANEQFAALFIGDGIA
jgi:hypothetical protein